MTQPSKKDETLLLPPYNLEAEEAILGSILLDSEMLNDPDVVRLEPKDFHTVKHQWIWEAILVLAKRRDPIDLLTLDSELKNRKQSEEIGGTAYLTRLVSFTVTAFNAGAYARLVMECADRRAIIKFAGESAKLAYETGTDIETIKASVRSMALSLDRGKNQVDHISVFASELYDQTMLQVSDPKDVWGMSSGFADYDKATGGLHKKETLLLTGEPGKGKTLKMMQICMQLAGLRLNGTLPDKKHSGVFVEMEMSGVPLTRRIVSAKAEVKSRAIRSGHMTESDISQFTAAIEYVSELPIYMSDATSWTTSSLRAMLTRMKDEKGIEWFAVDYLELLKNPRGKMSDIERVSEISHDLHDIAKDLDLAGLVVQRMNKAGMGAAVADLEHLAGSAQVVYDADVVLLINDHIPKDKNEKPNPAIRTCVFRKIREDNPQQAYDLVMFKQGIPAFGDVIKPDGDERIFFWNKD